ncbi:hypothetical protein, partial [Ignavibacterium sp.]|uniref:hypothetical protein n=1 Tax=Ignavibacterium sp. TaxID=2651167 RepID=UPI00307ED715
SFNVVITGGSEFGMLLDPNTGTIADNLQGVSNGFKVITATSIPNDSVVIRIRVNTMAGNGGIIAAKIVNNKTQNSITKQINETEINKSSNSMSSTLSIGNPGMMIEGYGDVVVKQDECDFDNCGDFNYGDLDIIMNRQPNNFEFREGQFITVCDSSNPNTTTDDVGQSKPVPYERKRKELNWGNSWEVEPCLNNDGKVQFSIVTPDRLTIADLYFDFVEAVCTDIITNPPNNGIIITDLSLSGVTSGKDAMNDFCGHQLYPIRTGTSSRGGYYIEEVIRVHEGIHGDRFYKILNRNKQMLINELNKMILDCQEYEKFWKIDGVEQHIINALNTYYQFCETEYFTNNNEQEIQCHFAIRELIEQYMDQVSFRFGTNKPTFPCYNCPN